MVLAGDDEPEAAAERRDGGVMGVPDELGVDHVGRALPGFWWGTYGRGGGQMPGWSGLLAEHMTPARPRNMHSAPVPKTSSYTCSSPVMMSRSRRRNAVTEGIVGVSDGPCVGHVGRHDDDRAGAQDVRRWRTGTSPVICWMQWEQNPVVWAACFQRRIWPLARALAG